MRALARGPAAVIRPIGDSIAPAPAPVCAVPLPESFLPDYDATPSAFPVALRATQPPPDWVEESRPAPVDEAPGASLTSARAPAFQPRLLAFALLLAGLLSLGLWILLAR
jgi:hypothetical protein